MKFNVKKESFALPTWNSIGLKILYSAWCLLFEDIFNNDNALFAFVDEAVVKSHKRRNYGRFYEGITPVMNCSLTKIAITIVAILIPCY